MANFNYSEALEVFEANVFRSAYISLDRPPEDADKLEAELKKAYARINKVFICQNIKGAYTQNVILEFKTRNDLNEIGDSIKYGETNLHLYKGQKISPVMHKRNIKPDLMVRRIPKFSGDLSTGTTIEDWIMSVDELLAGDRWLDEDVYQLIRGSLTGSALIYAKTLSSINPYALRDFVHRSFGQPDCVDSLQTQLSTIVQLPSERPSEYLTRLNYLVTRINRLQQGIIQNVPNFLVQKFLSGVEPDDYNYYDVKMSGASRQQFTSFAEIHEFVRGHELKLLERNRKIRSSLNVSADCPVNAMFSTKRAESKVNKDTNVVSQSSPAVSEVDLLRKELNELRMSIRKGQPVTPARADADDPGKTGTAEVFVVAANAKKNPRQRPRTNNFCYKCGQNSHVFENCNNPSNSELVQKLLQERSRRNSAWNKKPE